MNLFASVSAAALMGGGGVTIGAQSLAWTVEGFGAGSYSVVSNGGKDFSCTWAGDWCKARVAGGRLAAATGKYAEVTIPTRASGYTLAIGVATAGTIAEISSGGGNNAGNGGRHQYFTNGNKVSGGVSSAYGAAYTAGDVIGIGMKLVSGSAQIRFYKNGVDQGVAFNLAAATSYEIHVCDDYAGTGGTFILRLATVLLYPPAGYVNW